MKKFLALTLFLLLFITAWSVAAFAAAATGYDPETGRIILPSEAGVDNINNNYYIRQQQIQQQNDLEEIRQAEARYQADQEAREEREKIRQWEKLDMEIKLRQYDKLVMGMEKEYHAAKQASNPFLGEQGYVIYPYGEVVPVITCRPLRMTDVALEPGEEIMGIHAGDTVRWQFSPSQSMKNGLAVAHIVVKPNQPGISTNLLVHTNKRTYNLDFTASDKAEYLRGVAFSYGDSNNLSYLFVNGNAGSSSSSKKDKKLEDELQETMGDVDFNGLYTQYTILNNSKVDWAPEAVFDDGNKTYLRMPFRFSETPAFYISLDRRETMTNFRVKGRYYIVDRLFDKAYLKIGRKRVVLVRKDKLIDTNIRESRRSANPLSFREPEGR
ncbi:MAG: TrbG/VirB9 family P-type conjugative transfer protein [Synergistaceae bacterium]|nr:TrbG/VirB9 family P-type conjugative transfer protein [Synergistaceae bacterium]MBR0221767.1 TrbG/VirB9 family P-type conjugative transfer protein [Synergistaceae bacterium]